MEAPEVFLSTFFIPYPEYSVYFIFAIGHFYVLKKIEKGA